MASLGDRHRLGEELGRVELRKAHAQPQVALGVGVERVAAGANRCMQADRGQRVLQRPARAHVHVHVARGDEREAGTPAQLAQLAEARPVVRPAQQLRGDPGAAGEALGDDARVLGVMLAVGNQQGEAPW